ncbi:MAG TPA: response regulator [bacterium]|nr:response regulator [bacterium]
MREGKIVIVHVDDSRTAREMVREALTEAGYEVHSAEDAQDLEQRLLANDEFRASVDLFVLDMEMPDLMGAQVGAIIDAVYEDLTHIPFIIYSGKQKEWVEKNSAEVASMSPGFQKNYKGYVSKDAGAEKKLLELIGEIVGSRKQ